MWVRCVISAVLAPAILQAGPQIERITYHGWSDAYRLSNQETEVVVVPQVGRIMRYALTGEKNVLWEDQQLEGQPGSRDAWRNFGGDKVWLWPEAKWLDQSECGWCPPYECAQAPHRAEIVDSSTLRIISAPVAGYGVRIVREISLAPTGSRVLIRSRLESAGKPGPFPLAVWSVAQLPPPDLLLARLVAGSRLPSRYKLLSKTPWDSIFDEGGGLLRLEPPTEHAAKVGMDANLLAWLKDGVLLTAARLPADSPLDGVEPGDMAQVFSTPGRGEQTDPGYAAPYIELEFTSPQVRVQDAASTTLHVAWELKRIPPDSRTARAIADLIRPDPK